MWCTRGIVVAVFWVALLAGCAAPPEKPPAEPEVAAKAKPPEKEPEVVAPLPTEKVEGTPYTIDADATDVRILVYRGGRLASMGHNHTVAARDVNGTVVLTDTLTGSRVEMTVPVNAMVVDDPAHRKDAGPEFSSKPSQKDIDGTRKNMLSERGLDAENYPTVSIVGTVAGASPPDIVLDLDLTIRGVTRRVQAPAKLQQSPDRLVASGELKIRQTDFGMTPYSVLVGALKVQDELTLQYRVVATLGK